MIFRSLASLRVAVSFAALLVLSACSDDRQAQLSAVETIDIPAANAGSQANQNIANPTLEIPVTYPVEEGDELTLVWSEEFDGPEIDPGTWFFATGDGTEVGLPGGWGNNELQYYLPDNAMIVNGVLEITARRETVGNLNYTSARINTQDRFAFKYGRIEASMKLPGGEGLWPAFWMLSQDSDYLCSGDPCVWAAIGEIDIVEAVNLDGTGGNEIFATIHYGDEFPANQSTETRFTPSVDVTESFNTYALEWDEDEIRWYLNGALYASQPSSVWFSAADNAGPNGPFDQNFHILLNLAVGGNFPGSPDGTTPWPVTMEVDWVRVYSGEPPPASPGAVPENGVFVTDPNGNASLAPPGGLDNFGSGATFNTTYAGDSDFKPTLRVISGNAYEGNPDVGFVAFVGYQAGFAANYETLSFKVKGLPGDELEVKFFGSPENSIIINLGTYPGAMPLGNGWYQVTVPMSEFAANVYAFTGFLIGPPGDQGAPFSFLLTDIGFNGSIVTAPADPGATPDVTLYDRGAATDLVFGEDYTEVAVFSSGAIANNNNTGDVDFSPAFSVSTGFGYNKWNAQLAFVGFDAGFASSYVTLDFKVKGMAGDVIRVKLLNDPDPAYVDVDLTSVDYATALGNGWYQVAVPIADFPGDVATASGLLFETIEPAPDASFTFLLNDIGFSGTVVTGDGELLSNGGFEAGQEPWVNQGVVVPDGPDNNVLRGVPNDPPNPGQPFLVNASQIIPITPGETYTLTFRARASVARNIIAGIGLNGGPGGCCDFRNNSEVVPLTTEWQAFTYTLKANDDTDGSAFGDDASRVLFDMNGEAGDVFIDDVSLKVGSLLSNGDFEAGQEPWINQGVVVPDGPDNNVLQGVPNDPPNPGQPFLVNASQIIPITPDETYVLTFKARASEDRSILAGIGLNGGPGGCCDFRNNTEVVSLTTEWQTFTYTLQSLDDTDGSAFGDDASRVLFDMNGAAGTVFIDDVALAVLGPIGSSGDGELLSNGDFEAGQEPWVNQGVVVPDGPDNNVLRGVPNDPPNPGQPFLVNASQIIPITPGETYTLTFRARASVARNIIAGIGLNGGPGGCCDFRNNSEVVPLTTEWQAFTYTLKANDDTDGSAFGDDASRVLFDMNGEAGDVFIDDVSLKVGSLLSNGDFEAGQEPWINQGVVVPDGPDNNVLQGVPNDPPNPGQPFLVNASQIIPITPDETYVLTFKARASEDRSILAGIGLNGGPGGCCDFRNNTEVVSLTTEWQTFTYTLQSLDDTDGSAFGDDASRVLFDMNGEAGTVMIDDVALAVLGPVGSSGGGGNGGVNLAINGDFEAGDTSGWTFEANAGTFGATTAQANGGSYSGNLVASVPGGGGPASFPVIKQANVGVGTVQPNSTVTVSFDLFGSVSGAGGVFFAEFFSELSGGGTSSSVILGGGPLFPNGTWQTYTFTPLTGADVSGGVTLQLKADCGGNPGCTVDAYIDNVTITTN